MKGIKYTIQLTTPVPVSVKRHSNIKKKIQKQVRFKISMSKSLPFNPKNTWNDRKEPLAHKRIVERSTTKKKSIITTSYLVIPTAQFYRAF